MFSYHSAMYKIKLLFIIFALLQDISIQGQEIGEICQSVYRFSTCQLISDCPYAQNLLRFKQRPSHCGYSINLPIVCCPRPGDIAYYKCDRYTDRNYYPFFSGQRTEPKEFTHMANLGYGDATNIKWLCGGSLISHNFVLTAAHCINSNEFGRVQWIRVGDLDLNSTTDNAQPQTIKVKKVFIHPDFRPPSHYHDIALIELEQRVEINEFVRIACLSTTKDIPESEQIIATGWGKTDFAGETSSHLLKIYPKIVPFDQCSKFYRTVTKQRLPEGIRDDIQICAGHPDGRDACQGDSGGPLQIEWAGTFPPYYDIIGVTSFGKACGITYSAGVYVRVFPYLGWIESIVWPTKD